MVYADYNIAMKVHWDGDMPPLKRRSTSLGRN